ncbi:hypothetical protein CW731_13795 [Polaribacter sp. ALD11]|nr:hypothetical protein CW731_13795 [Polaribacter sp. ALD11]
MRVLPFRIIEPENNTLVYLEDIEMIFYDKLHQHHEVLVSFIEKEVELHWLVIKFLIIQKMIFLL